MRIQPLIDRIVVKRRADNAGNFSQAVHFDVRNASLSTLTSLPCPATHRTPNPRQNSPLQSA